MAKYVISYRAPEDYVPGREDDMAAWAAWFKNIGEDLELFPTWLCCVNFQGVDCLGELPGAPGAAAELAEDTPGFKLGVRALAGCAKPGAGARLACFCDSGLFFPRYGIFAYALPW
jgi:hypothetical protein